MPAPLAKGVIIAASVLVAAGLAIYESPQVRQWVDDSRRKIAVALHSLGDEIHPRRQSESSADFDARNRHRDDLIRKNRNEFVRRARDEGVAVDLDELAKIGREDMELAERRQRYTANRQKSFDELVGTDGMLKQEIATTTGIDEEASNLRKRGFAGLAAGSATAAVMTNPFSDDNIFFDHDEDHSNPKPAYPTQSYVLSRDSSATVDNDTSPPAAVQLIDVTSESTDPFISQIPVTYSSQEEEQETEATTQSFYSFSSSPSASVVLPVPIEDLPNEQANTPTGTLTPRSEASAFTDISVVDSQADDIAVLSMLNATNHDARSETFTDDDYSDVDVESRPNGATFTHSSWTDVGSDDESEWGGVAQGGHMSQIHP